MTQGEMVTDFQVTGAKIADVIKALNAHMKKVGLEPEEYGFTYADPREKAKSPWLVPDGLRWLVAFAIEGGSEGYYVHVGAMVPSPKAFWYDAIDDARKALCKQGGGFACEHYPYPCPAQPFRKVQMQAHGDDFPSTYTYLDFGFCKTYSAESAYAIQREAQRFLTAAMWN